MRKCAEGFYVDYWRIRKRKRAEKQEIEKVSPSEEELEVCAYIQNIIMRAGKDIGWIRYKRNSSNYVDVLCLYTFLKFKFTKKEKYIIVKRETIKDHTFIVEPFVMLQMVLKSMRVDIAGSIGIKLCKDRGSAGI